MKKTGLRHPARVAGSSFLRLQSDERLAELAAAGHEAAFDAIVVRYRAALLRYCGAIVGSSRAEDAVQQTLLNAHAALGDADEVRHVRSWLYRIAHNVSLNLLRSVRDDVPLDAAGLRLPATESPAESFESSEQFRATVAALQALPERQRAALVLRELEGRSHEEIAEAMGVSAGSARQHLMRARVAMRGAVTAITPWGLIVRIAEMASAGGGAPGGLEAAAGAGLGAGLAKLTAGVMATGALVGGAAVGTHEVVRHDTVTPARADTIDRPAKPRTTAARAAGAAATLRTATTALAAPSRHSESASGGESEHHHRGRGRGKDDTGGDRHQGGHGHGGDHKPAKQTTSAPTADDHKGRGGESESRGRDHRGGDDRSADTEPRSSGSGRHSGRGDVSGSGSGSSKSGSSGKGKGKSGGGDDTSSSNLSVPTSTSGSDSGSSGSSDSGSTTSGSGSDDSSTSDDSGSGGSSGSGKSGGDSSGSGSDD